MRMKKIVPAVALSVMSFGAVATVAMPAAHAASPHAYAAGEDGGDVTTPTNGGGGGGGGGGTPSGGASTGGGGMAKAGSQDLTPFLALGGAGAVLLGASGASALTRRRRTVNA